ncbi:MAG: aminotransferase class I/II-fold pyridoxal phosphate-dependent enzyme [Flavobacteriales bacterium]|nr:aminotransferase class I/II-fold pyridoxal phosphate-dependent enzyme [Flavobacteriales bacterium]
MDIFDKLKDKKGPLGQFREVSHGYFTFPKLEGPIGNKMNFRGKEQLVWSVNNYLGLANHPEVRRVDAEAAADFGLSSPMGARIMSGNTVYHEKLEEDLSKFVGKEDTLLINYGYMGMSSAIDALVDRNDVIVYDSESHACIIDGVRMHQGKRFVYPHNQMDKLEVQLDRATRLTKASGGGILVITEGVFGMAGDQGLLKEIVALKDKYQFRLFVDDAHGIGTLGKTGAGTGEEQGVQDGIDIYFGTFAKSFASIGGFISSDESIINYLRYNTRSQIFAKSMPMPLVLGNQKRLELLRDEPIHKQKLWDVTTALQSGLKAHGFNIGETNSCVTPVLMNGGIIEATNMIFDMRENYQIFCSLVVYPVVPKEVIMLRLIPTANHTLEDVNYTIEKFEIAKAKLDNQEYSKDKLEWAEQAPDWVGNKMQ